MDIVMSTTHVAIATYVVFIYIYIYKFYTAMSLYCESSMEEKNSLKHCSQARVLLAAEI